MLTLDPAGGSQIDPSANLDRKRDFGWALYEFSQHVADNIESLKLSNEQFQLMDSIGAAADELADRILNE